MKVLLTIPDLCADAGGPPVVVVRMAGALRDLGVAVNLLYATPPDRASLAIPAGVTAHAVKWTGNAWNRYRAFRVSQHSALMAAPRMTGRPSSLWRRE